MYLLQSLLKVNIWLVIAGCVAVGLVLGVIIILIAAPSQPTKPATPKPITTPINEDSGDRDDDDEEDEDDDDDDHHKKE